MGVEKLNLKIIKFKRKNFIMKKLLKNKPNKLFLINIDNFCYNRLYNKFFNIKFCYKFNRNNLIFILFNSNNINLKNIKIKKFIKNC